MAPKPEPSAESKAELRAAIADEPGAAWADDGVARRYLRARKFDMPKATAMLQETLRWRDSFDEIPPTFKLGVLAEEHHPSHHTIVPPRHRSRIHILIAGRLDLEGKLGAGTQ